MTRLITFDINRSDNKASYPLVETEGSASRPMLLTILLAVIATFLITPIIAMGLTTGLSHDEQTYLTASILIDRYKMYTDFHYNHLPTLPLLNNLVFNVTGSTQYFLAGRVIQIGAWGFAILSIFMISKKLTQCAAAGWLSVIFFVTSSPIVSYRTFITGTHVIPIGFCIFGLYFLLSAREARRWQATFYFFSGACLSVATGFRVSYIFAVLAATVAVTVLTLRGPLVYNLRSAFIPFAAGGLIAGIPTLFYAFRDFDAFMFNTLYYFESQTEFRDSAEGAVGNFAMTLREKLVFAHDWWATGPNVVIMAFATAALVTVVMVPGFRHDPAGFFRPPLVLAILAFVAAFVMSFQVTPMWPGYLIPPIVMAIVLGAAAFGMLDARVRRSALPLLVAAALVAVITMSPARFVVNLPKLFERDQWTGVLVHRGAQELGRHMRAAGFADPATQIASVAPILVLEAGFSIFNELSAGPFFYRSGNFMSPEQRARFNVLSVDTADAFLRERRPAAILVGAYDPTRPDYFLEVPFIRFAEEAGYHRVDLGPVPGGNILYLRPPDLGDAVATDDRGWPGTP